ncbi:MAG: hypothetical protein A2Y00_06375 [Omnitrophica WOR_2 bacterium GWF2_43_52]|nr:MAG: hypothetical protein A2Y01_08420 [Omnitrophica WOR_2 bacterium GWC2_44_8]OGX22758.1 MAG: hypothetical protein A2Y00_06375 [Omnitrophica WOR_2 bacterium GWF2_43_52]OGX53751.1 MAG: hypothetical protein A2460_05185 [Omnitrophica WOR_2 bacterium RIFOXYC2_FULL_43_9]HAH19575.1 hypothetical protein [Candidatus Omnitrophota bacterium]HBG64389.1 hypothetical protein [Candidatus Omnitrophota bacterium]
MKNRGLRVWVLCSVLSVFSFQFFPPKAGPPVAEAVSPAQDELKKIKQLEAQILSDVKDKKAVKSLEMLSEMYFGQQQYDSFVAFLKKLDKKKPLACELPVGYYIALCRFHQLLHWEETQNWKEYFDLGSTYRQELFAETEKIAQSCPVSAVGIRAQVLSWIGHKTHNDEQAEDALKKLLDMVNVYAKSAVDIQVLKDVADTLARHGEKGFAKSVYGSYVSCLLNVEQSPLKLQAAAEGALKESNSELAEIIYDRYIEIVKGSLAKDNLAGELTLIIKSFATDGWSKGSDPVYAEKVFAILKEACGKEYFTQELQYIRAYNLQRQKEYQRAAEEYAVLLADFPKSRYVDEAEFKLGILSAYILDKKENALTHWQNIISRNVSLGYVAESLYQRGLLYHYEENLEPAKVDYTKLLELITGNADFENLLERVNERQKEIQELGPIEYNLKMFLDSVFKKLALHQAAPELFVAPYKALSFQHEQVTFSLMQLQMETGCFAPELTYLWSGDLGGNYLAPTTAEFTAQYQSAGTKVVNLVVVSPSGVVGSTLEMVDVYDQQEKLVSK